jgi:hypothetical protein
VTPESLRSSGRLRRWNGRGLLSRGRHRCQQKSSAACFCWNQTGQDRRSRLREKTLLLHLPAPLAEKSAVFQGNAPATTRGQQSGRACFDLMVASRNIFTTDPELISAQSQSLWHLWSPAGLEFRSQAKRSSTLCSLRSSTSAIKQLGCSLPSINTLGEFSHFPALLNRAMR